MVERAFALVVAAQACVVGARSPHSVNLIDKDDARGFLFGLAKKVAHAACAHAHEHLHKIAARHGEKRHIGFAGYGLGQQRFARSRRTDKQRTFGNFTTQIGIFFRIFQKRNNLFHLLFRPFEPSHIFESYFRLAFVVFVEQLRFRFPYAEYAACASSHAAVQEDEKENQQQKWQHRIEKNLHIVAALFVRHLASECLLFLQFRHQFRHLVDRAECGADVQCVGGVVGFLPELLGAAWVDFGFDGLFVATDNHRFDAAVAQPRLKFGVGYFARHRVAVREPHHDEKDTDSKVDPIEIEPWLELLRLVRWLLLLLLWVVVHSVSSHLVDVGVFLDVGVGPQVFDVVEGACFALEQMHDNAAVVERNPFCIFESIGGKRFFACMFAHILFQVVANGRHMRVRIALADDKILARSVQFGHINRNDAFGFFLLHARYDGINQFFLLSFHAGVFLTDKGTNFIPNQQMVVFWGNLVARCE